MIRSLVLVGVLLVSCGDHVASGGVTGGSPSATASASASPKLTLTPNPSPIAPVVAFPDRLWFVVGTSDGFVYPELVQGKPAGTAVRACDGQVGSLVSLGRKVLVVCRDATLRLGIVDVDAGTLSVIPGVRAYEAAWTVNGDAVFYTTPGACENLAPICKTKLLQRDLRTGATTQIDEQYGVGNDLRLTGIGVMVWRPMNALSFVRKSEEAGTWAVRGTALERFSPQRFVDGWKGRYVLETEETSMNAGCCTSVISLTQGEQRLTPSTVSNERAIALLEDGRIVAFRPDLSNLTEGSMVIYRAGTVERTDRGRFSAFRTARVLAWIVGIGFGPGDRLLAYDVTSGVFASAPGDKIVALAPLGPAKPVP